MNAHRHEPPVARGPVHGARRTPFWLLVVLLVAGLEIIGTLAVPTTHGPGGAPGAAPSADAISPAPALAPSVAPAVSPAANLVVGSGATVYLPEKAPPSTPSTYYQGGNITVQHGGTLIVQNTTLSFVSYVADTGTITNRLGHVYHFVDNGTVIFSNATLSTDAFVLNPFAKLDVLVRGTMEFFNSNVESAGFLNVLSGGVLTFNESSLRPNPDAASLDLPNTTLADMSFAPTLSVEAGGTANLFSSAYVGLYGDNLTHNGTPGQVPLSTGNSVTVANATTVSSFSTPTTSDALIADYAYAVPGVKGGSLTIRGLDGNAASTTVTPTVTYGGVGFTLTPVTILAGVSQAYTVPFTAGLTSAIQTAGVMTYLNRTGDFGAASGISVSFHISNGPNVGGMAIDLDLKPAIDFGASVSGAASLLNTVDTAIGLTFETADAEPWAAHTLNLTDGATAELGNLTTLGKVNNTGALASESVLSTDASSNAYLFRWADVKLHGRGGALPMPGGSISAPYAYALPQFANKTAQRVNNFKSNDKSIWGYLESWDGAHGVAVYGQSGPSGVASLLLASNAINGTVGPDGQFLGNYHVLITPADGAGNVLAFNWSVSAYPLGVAFGSTGYGKPDLWGSFTFPLFFAAVTVASPNGVAVTADNASATVVRIGQQLGVSVTLEDEGSAVIHSLYGMLWYNGTRTTELSSPSDEVVHLTAPGQTATYSFTWKVNDVVVGLKGPGYVNDTLSFDIVWNNNTLGESGGVLNDTQAVQFAPSAIAIADLAGPADHTLTASKSYGFSANIIYNGSQAALVELYAVPAKGSPILLEQTSTVAFSPPYLQNGTVTFSGVKVTALHPGTAYTLEFGAQYNGKTVLKALPGGTYEVPAPAAKSLLLTKVLGEPLWLWIAIAAGAVVAILLALMFLRRQAAGKVVECGECGNLIPETARTCPKCGAEFESDVVRCSRCSSTIPASSQYCPECAAQLLGKPGEGGAEPERQAYADFTERFRAEAKKDLGENYNEGSFWDWWKRQPTYTPFSQWKLQQGQGTSRSGMTAPPAQGRPPSGGAPRQGPPAARKGGPGQRPPSGGGAPPSGASAAAPPSSPPPAPAAPPEAAAAAVPGAAGAESLRPCPNCGKEIPREYLVCPFCGSVTQ
ncbi:MAG TPA: zinc ribbon domain-containing protein [Thermoplasmata archaeon]|nr:zinc ribbon domain-containing protein [Thermoplasmata archaeon]